MGRLRVGWLVRVKSESFSTLVLKTCGPINTTRDTSIFFQIEEIVSCMIILCQFLCYPCPIHPYKMIKWFFLVFRTCYHHRGLFSLLFWGGSAPRPMTRSATLGRAFSLDEAFSGTIDMPYVLYMLLLHISMLSFTFILRVASAVSLSVRRTRPASTGFRHEYAGSSSDCLN